MAKSPVYSEKLLLAAVAVAIFMDGMDGSVVNVAMPAIASAFGTDTSSVSWVIVLYFMTLAGLILVFGRIADRGALKKVFVYGFGIFTVASLLCGISYSLPMLFASRILQGTGGAMIAASAPMLCVKYVSPKKLGFALSTLTLGSSVGYAVGPVLGGILTEFLSWHWIFLINIPIGILAVPFAVKAIPKDGPTEKRPLDLMGSAFMFAAIASGILSLERLSDPDALKTVIVSAVLCVIFLILFILRELSFDKPVIDVRIFKSGKFSSSLLSFTLFNLSYMGPFYLIPFYMALCLEFSYAAIGVYLFVSSLMTAIICLPAGRYSDRYGRRRISVLGISILLVSTILLLFANAKNGSLILVPVVIMMGTSWGLCGGPMAARIVEHSPSGHEKMGSSLSSLAIYLGMGIGTAVFAAFFSIFTGVPGTGFDLLTAGEFSSGFRAAIILAALLSAVTVVIAAAVPDSEKSGKQLEID